MTQRWAEIYEFPGYSVSDNGQVRNDKTGRLFNKLRNQNDVIYVGLVKNGKQHKLSVAKLVAQMFLPDPLDIKATTVTHIDTDFDNLNYWNLVWRRRHFAIAYHKQYSTEPYITRPIRLVETGEIFQTSWEACMKYALLDVDIVMSITNGSFVVPIGQRFELVE